MFIGKPKGLVPMAIGFIIIYHCCKGLILLSLSTESINPRVDIHEVNPVTNHLQFIVLGQVMGG